MQTQTPETVRDILQRQTATAHERVERLFWTDRGFPSRRHYDGFLRGLQSAHATLGLPAAEHRGAEAVFAELAALDALSRDVGPAPLPLQTVRTESEGWGISYALIGSALGASVILKSGHIPEDWPTEYLAHMQRLARSGSVKRFFSTIDDGCSDPETGAAGALRVFAVIERHHP